MKNISYTTKEIALYFSTNRIKWKQFYDSEKEIFKKLDLNKNKSVLDIGCGCGGLGLALEEKFSIEDYTGIDINQPAIEAGKLLNPGSNLLIGDVLDVSKDHLKTKQFDLVCSLSCIDWNVEFRDMLAVAWDHVKPGGDFVATFRLTDKKGTTNFNESHQYINYEGKKEGELAAYVVLNIIDLFSDLKSFMPKSIKAKGYWGAPSSSAVTPYSELCFAAFAIKKRKTEEVDSPYYELDLPPEIVKKLDLTS